MADNFVWAIDENGKPCKCKAKPENRGKRNCKHQFHQEPGQSKEEFLSEHGIKTNIFTAETVEVLPYRMTEEEKEDLLKIESKKDFMKQCDNGAYFELSEPLWNDMDKNYFVDKFGMMSRKELDDVLHEEAVVVLDGNDKFKKGKVFTRKQVDNMDPDTFEQLRNMNISTGVPAMNALAREKGWHATKDIYVLPYYMRQGVADKDGKEQPSDETEAYLHVFSTRSYSYKSRQKAYEALISNPGNDKKIGSVYRRKSLSDRLSGKKGVWRKEITGVTIPYTGRAVATPDVDIPYDQTRIPPAVAVDIFRPTITENLKKNGFTPEQISEVIRDAKRKQSDVTPLTKNIIQRAMDEGNVRVIINRQPTLHSASMQGLKPLISDSPTICVNPLIAGGFNLDHDGDTMAIIGINNSDISKTVDKEMHPSNFKFTPKKQDELNMKPTKDSLFGIMNVLKRRTN